MSTDPDPDLVSALGESPLFELRVKGSRFLARVHPAETREEFDRALARERAEFPDATHHCSAARLLTEDRSDDDGEPGGTAGAPILRALESAEVRGVCCVVIRYYGGTKLGTGGLIRAYGEAAREAVALAPRSTSWSTASIEVSVEFDDLGAVEGILRKYDGEILAVERRFEPDPVLVVTTKASRRPLVAEALRDATSGRAQIDLS